ncbi:MAG: hypothetical protein WD872_19835 [Pirellulaceae bacterium]
MRHLSVVAAALMALVGILPAQNAWALGTEEFGNQPLSPANYTQWPGIVPLVNDAARVYQNWVNGNEHFYYRGTTKQLNAAVAHFAKVEMDKHVVVLRPGPGVAPSFHERKTPFNWSLHVIGGIAQARPAGPGEEFDWPKHPLLTIYTGGDIDLAKLEIPAGVSVVAHPADEKGEAAAKAAIAAYLEAREREAEKP